MAIVEERVVGIVDVGAFLDVSIAGFAGKLGFVDVLVVGRAGDVSALFDGGGLGGFGGFTGFESGDVLVALVVWLSAIVGLTFRVMFADFVDSTCFTGTCGGF